MGCTCRTVDERRYFILEVSDKRSIGYTNYFKSIMQEMESGGYEAMLHELLNRDISDFVVTKYPESIGLDNQKRESLAIECKWWQDVLARGFVWQSKLGLEETFSVWYTRVTTSLLYNSYLEFVKNAGNRYPMTREDFGKLMHNFGAVKIRPREGIRGEHLVRSDKTVRRDNQDENPATIRMRMRRRGGDEGRA